MLGVLSLVAPALLVGVCADELNVLVSGDCNDEAGPHNGLWLALGLTASGRPYYKLSGQEYYMQLGFNIHASVTVKVFIFHPLRQFL